MKVKITGGGETKEFEISLVKDYFEYDPATMTVTAGNEHDNDSRAANVLDNQLNTIWHTSWNGCQQSDVWIQFDLGESKAVAMLKYISRPSGDNGIFEEYKVEISNDNSTWTEADHGTWNLGSGSTGYAKFDTMQARYVKLSGLKTKLGEAGKIFGTAAEIRIGYEDDGTEIWMRAKTGASITVTGNEIQDVSARANVQALKDKLEYSRNAVLKVLKADGTEASDSDLVRSDMRVEITLGTQKKTYTISMAKTYLEYEPDENMTATAKSQESEDEGASKVLDGNTNTIWHTAWSGNIPQEDVWIQIDLGAVKPVAMVKYIARASGGVNGIFQNYKVEVSSDGTNWSEADSGTWNGEVGATEYAKFETVEARYVKLYGVVTKVAAGDDAEAGKIFGTAAEIRIGYEATEE